MWRKLIWKEWHEQRWRLAFGCVLFGGCMLIGLKTRMMWDTAVITMGLVFAAPLLAILASMSPVATERDEGTHPMLMALPCAAWKVLLVKTVMALLVCLGPIVTMLIVSLAVAGGREAATWDIFRWHCLGALVTTMLLVWSLAFGVRQPTEARAALVALAIPVAWFVSGSLTLAAILSGLVSLGAYKALHPIGGLGALFQGNAMLPYWLAVQTGLMVALWLWAARRWTRPGRRVA